MLITKNENNETAILFISQMNIIISNVPDANAMKITC